MFGFLASGTHATLGLYCVRGVLQGRYGACVTSMDSQNNTLLPLKAAGYWSDLEGLGLTRAGQLMLKLQQVDQNLASLRQERIFLH